MLTADFFLPPMLPLSFFLLLSLFWLIFSWLSVTPDYIFNTDTLGAIEAPIEVSEALKVIPLCAYTFT